MKGFFVFVLYNVIGASAERRWGMNAADRRMEIINILIIKHRITAQELAEEFGVTTRTIQNDIQALSPGYPIYTKPGGDGGIFIREDYNPHSNILTPAELETLHELYEGAKDIHRKIIFEMIQKYGPDKLEI